MNENSIETEIKGKENVNNEGKDKTGVKIPENAKNIDVKSKSPAAQQPQKTGRGPAPTNNGAPFYLFRHGQRPVKVAVKLQPPALSTLGGYHPKQKRTQQFMTRQHDVQQPKNNQVFLQQRPAPGRHYREQEHQTTDRRSYQSHSRGGRRRRHLVSCNDANLGYGYHGQRRRSRSTEGSKDNISLRSLGSPVVKHKSHHKHRLLHSLRDRSSHSETAYSSNEVIYKRIDITQLDEAFSESGDEKGHEEAEGGARKSLPLPLPHKRIHTLSGTVPSVGYSPVWGGPTMCLGCFEFFDLPNQTLDYVQHLLGQHKLIIDDIESIVDLKRYVENWRHRFETSTIDKILPKVEPKEGEPLHGKVDAYYLMSPSKNPDDMQIRQRLAMRRLEEVLACQQRERDDHTFSRQCLFCRYHATGNRSTLIHHLYMIHHLNLGSPDNLVFATEYLDILEEKLQNGICIFCEVQFPNRQELDMHMREKGHREVNPNNSLYDKFYVINYLELGKKWLDVLAEDFEDTMPTFVDSEEEEEEETWHEWHEDDAENEQVDLLCLLCDRSDTNLTKLLAHMKDDHGFDLKSVVKQEKMHFYDRVKFINYVRACCHHFECFVCGDSDLHSWSALSHHLSQKEHPGHVSKIPSRQLWDKEEFLIPTFENDALLCELDELDDDKDAHHDQLDQEASTDEIRAAALERARQSLPPDPAILSNGVVLDNDNRQAPIVVPEDLVDVSQSILNDKELREALN